MNEAPSPNRPLVLVVDDEASMRAFLRVTLEHEGFRVVEAKDGFAGLQAFNTEAPDAVVLDVIMPEMDGFNVCEAIRGLPGGADLPILMVTGLSDRASISRAFQSGASDFASKPVQAELLGHRVRQLLDDCRARRRLARSEADLGRAARAAALGRWEWTAGDGLVRCDAEAMRLLDLHQEVIDLPTLDARVAPDDRARVAAARRGALAGASYQVDFKLPLKAGGVRHLREQGDSVLGADRRVVALGAVVHDVSALRQSEETVRRMARYDSHTGLANRERLRERLDQELTHARAGDALVAVVMLDLAGFHRINESAGRHVGDAVLRNVAARLSHCVREEDSVARPTAGRCGGDEFALLVPGLGRVEDVASVARRLVANIEQPHRVDGREIALRAHIGVAVFPTDGADADTLMANAEAALFHAREHDVAGFQFYSESMHRAAVEQASVEEGLRRALEQGGLSLQFQPRVNTEGRITAMEALLRWQHPRRGLIEAADFEAHAEEAGLGGALFDWALAEACRQAVEWRESALPPVKVAVQVSARQLRDPWLATRVARQLSDLGLPPDLLELEVSEPSMLRDAEALRGTLGRLHALGVTLSLGAFGSGQSCLSLLRDLPFDMLKIDPGLTRHVADNPRDAALTGAIIGIGRSLGFTVSCAGVDSPRQARALIQEGCEELAGYHIAKPTPAVLATGLLESGARVEREGLGAPTSGATVG